MRAAILDNLIWGILFLLLIPSGFAVASWNSLPGSRLFRVKLGMESGLLAIAPTAEVKGDFNIAFTERRFSEAKQLLANQASGKGLAYLDAQIRETKETIQKAPNRETQKKLAKKYIATLRNVHTQLEQQRQVIVINQYTTYQIVVTNPTNHPPPPAAATATPTPTPTPTSGENPPPPDDPVGDIDDTQDGIDDAIDELEELTKAASFEAASPEEPVEQTPTETPGRGFDEDKKNNGKKEKEITEPTKKDSWHGSRDEN